MSKHHHHSIHERRREHLKVVSWAFLITASFMAVEIIYGFLTNSLALLADGVHMLTDVASLGLTYFAFIVSRKPATSKKTFGYLRVEVLAAFVNSVFLSVLAVGIIVSAIQRINSPEAVDSSTMVIVAIVGLAINLISGFLLHKGSKENLNLRGAFLHVIGDALASVGTIVAGLLIYFYGWTIADPVVSLLIAIIIFVSAYRLMMETAHLIMQGVPFHLDTAELKDCLRSIPGVQDYHHLHVWSLSSDVSVLTVHLVVEPSSNTQAILESAKKILHERFALAHTTIQIEHENLSHNEPSF